MVDKDNLNVGQQQYEDQVNGSPISGGDNDTANYPHDYSTNQDYSNGSSWLKNKEKAASRTTASKSPSRDIGRQERSASISTKGFDGGLDAKSMTGSKRQHMGRFKKRLIAGGITLFASSGLAMGGLTFISGPMQLIQASRLIQDFQLGVANGQKMARTLSNIRSMAKAGAGDAETPGPAKGVRMNVLERHISEAKLTDLRGKGMGFKEGKITVDTAKTATLGSSGSSGLSAEEIAESLGINPKKIAVSGSVVEFESLSYSDARKLITAVDDVGKTGISSSLQTRATMKKLGYVSWAHPIKKLQGAIRQKAGDFIERLGDALQRKFDAKGKIKEGQDSSIDDLNSSADKDAPKIDADDVASGTDEALNSLSNNAETVGEKTLGKQLRGILGGATAPQVKLQEFLSMKGVTFVQLALGLICVIQGFASQVGPFKQTNIVNVAEKGAAQALGYGPQVESGQDIDMAAIGDVTRGIYGDEVELLDESGNSTNPPTTTFSSFWNAEPVCKTLGTDNCGSADNVPGPLKTVSQPGKFLGDEAADSVIDKVLGNDLASLACATFSGALTMVFGAANPLAALISMGLSFLLEQAHLLSGIMSLAASYIMGTPLDIKHMTPEQWGSVIMYGGRFLANDQMLGSGGKQLTDSQAVELAVENRRYLAWANGRKPLIARLVDPADYNSSLNQIARAARVNASDQGLMAQLSSTLKLLISAPHILATAGNQLLGGSGYASAASGAYDYGVPTFAWDMDEMDAITSGDDDAYDMDANTARVVDLLNGTDQAAFTGYANDCLNVTVKTDDGYKAVLNQNDDGTEWNYLDFNNQDAKKCSNRADQPDYKALRLYVMDYFNTVASACYDGDESAEETRSACKEMGADDTVGSSASASSKEGADLAAEFESDTGGTGDFDKAYGRQCVDLSLWYVAKYTALHPSHGNGNTFVQRMADANGDLGLKVSATPQAPAIFSADYKQLPTATDPSAGHTGVVVKVDDDGTIHTIETGSGQPVWYGTYEPDQYKGTVFANLKEFLK